MLIEITKEQIQDIITHRAWETEFWGNLLNNIGNEPPNIPLTTSPQGLYGNIMDFPRELVVRHDIADTPQVNIENLTQSIAKNQNLKQTEDSMRYKLIQEILETDNCRHRADGRFEWRQMIFGVSHHVIDADPVRFMAKYKAKQKEIKAVGNGTKVAKAKVQESRRLINLIREYYTRHIEGRVKLGTLKPDSALRYKTIIESHLCTLTGGIATYTEDDITDFLNDIAEHRNGDYCFLLLRMVFRKATKDKLVKQNVMLDMRNPFPKSMGKKGSWIDLNGQAKIMANLDKPFGKEMLFYLMTGCRRNEAFHTVIDFNKCVAHIDGTKTKTASRHVQLSKTFCDIIKDDWPTMFQYKGYTISKLCATFLESIGISGKSTHSLRHTFASNLYYLGVPDKLRQYLMGHASIVMTNDIYTTLDPTIKKRDIIDIWGHFYPKYT